MIYILGALVIWNIAVTCLVVYIFAGAYARECLRVFAREARLHPKLDREALLRVAEGRK